MIIHKFGGASVKDARSVKKMADICEHSIQKGIVVISAMSKTTNLLEQLTHNYFHKKNLNAFDEFCKFHNSIIETLEIQPLVAKHSHTIYNSLKNKLDTRPGLDYDFEYDQIVHYGELISTRIVSAYLQKRGLQAMWIDIRQSLRTDNTYRDAKVNWELSSELVKDVFKSNENELLITQGFIGADKNNLPTTLGREGSDYTAAILGNVLEAEKVVVWKDVPGILCADPKWMPNTEKIDFLSYLDAIELAFFGAKVIHPKTIKPLQNKNIPLQVRSFIDTSNEGTIINGRKLDRIPPVYIKKDKQVLVSIKPMDFSFIVEENLSHIFGILAANQIKVNLMQNSAISFSIAVDNDLGRVPKAIEELKQYYNVKYNEHLELITIRHLKPGAENQVLNGKNVLVEQKSRLVARYLVR